MNSLAARVILSGGWGRIALAWLLGAAGALALPPLGLLPALVVSLAPVVWLLDGAAAGRRHTAVATLGSAAWVGWWWGFGYFVAGLWWLGAAFLVEADEFAWALPLGVLGLPALLAFFPALGFALARTLWSTGPTRVLALAAGLGIAEWLRGTLFTGFPWNTPGMALGQHLWPMQAASLVGVAGLTVIAVALAAAPATLGTGTTSAERWTAPALAAAAFIALLAYGAARVAGGPVPEVAGVRLRLMQPNLPQDAKFAPENRDAIMRRYLDLSDRATAPGRGGVEDVTHLVWPESAFPFLLARDPRALGQIAALLPPGVTLITGAARADEPLPGEEGRRFFNAIQVVGDDGTILGSYDKAHLVPFGEYLPHALDALLRSLGLRQFVHVPGGFTAAPRRERLAVRGLPPVAATICYEAIFSGEVLADGPRPGLILNVTNDAWFGLTPGPYQHFAQARLRAVEEGLPLVRAANTGISAVIDPFGRILSSMPLGVEGTLDSPLPVAGPATMFHSFGPGVFLILVIPAAAACLLARRDPHSSRGRPQKLGA